VWYVEPDGSNVGRILAAMAANRQFIDKIDYFVFDEAIVTTCGLTMRVTAGRLPDEFASQTWHRDVIHLTGRKLVEFAECLAGNDSKRHQPTEIEEALQSAVQAGHIKREEIPTELRAKLAWLT